MKTVTFSETLIFYDGRIEIEYRGVPLREDININEARRMMKDFVDNHKHDNMLENVTILRTIFRDYKEEILFVYFCDKNVEELVRYDNKWRVNGFGFLKEVKGDVSCKYKIKYDYPLGLEINWFNKAGNIKKYTDDFSEIMKYISNLSNVGPIVINDNDKALIEIYKLFYKENPDFSSKDINVKVQTMMSILAGFNVTLDCDYSFSLMTKLKMPVSLKLEEMVKKMYPFGVVSEVEDNVKIAEEPKKIIEIVGDSVRDAIHDEEDINEALITISKVIHASRYNLSSKADISEIAEFTNQSVDDVEASVQLVKRIEHKINKEN